MSQEPPVPQQPLPPEPGDDSRPVFSRALADLYEQAGRPTYAELIRQAAVQRPPVKIADSSLSDWLTGVSVPSSPHTLAFLVSYLQPKAARNGLPERAPVWWEAQRKRAQQARRAGRGGRPRTRTPSDSDSPPPGRAAAEAQRLGRPLAQVSPIALEVHPAIDAGAAAAGLGALPAYLPRAHDEALAAIVARARDGESQIVVLVGGSSTGQTRALWEAVRGLEEPWRLWHPIDPGHPQAVLVGLQQAGPHTVIWLNETQHYLLTNDGVGEQVAAGLRELLRTPERGPVLVMGTLWPDYAAPLLAVSAAGQPDERAQARELLKGATLLVPHAFTGPELDTAARLAGTGSDPRWAEAMQHARDGALTQYMAGGLALIERYQLATVQAQAVLHAAMDARRLGHGLALPRLLLEQAAAGYLNDDQWNLQGDDWLEQALAYLTDPLPCRGVRPPLRHVRPRPVARPSTDDMRPEPKEGEPSYLLADYLEQHGTRTRHLLCPPALFWDAATHHAAPTDQAALARAADHRGRYRHAFNLWRRAANAGNTDALREMARIRERAGDRQEAERVYRDAADAGNIWALGDLARMREQAGDQQEAERLYRDAADAGDIWALRELVQRREQAGDRQEAERLARDADNTDALRVLVEKWEQAGDRQEAERLARDAADAGHSVPLHKLARMREEAGDRQEAERLAHDAADAGDPLVLGDLARMRKKARDWQEAERLYHDAADAGHPFVLPELARMREAVGDRQEAERLAHDAANAGIIIALQGLAQRWLAAGVRGRWEDLLRYGLKADGQIEDPW